MALNDTLEQMDFADVFRTFHPIALEYTFFSSVYGKVYRIYHILGHNSGPNKHKNIEIMPCILSDHNAMRLEVNHKKSLEKTTNMEVKEHSTKEQMGQPRNEIRNKKIT